MSDEPTLEEETPAPKKAGILMLVAPPIVAGVLAFGAAMVMPANLLGGGDDAGAADSEKKEKSEKAEKDKSKSSKLKAMLVTLDPLVVSLAVPDARGSRSPRLRVVVAVETYDADVTKSDNTEIILRDAFTATLRTFSAQTLGGEDGLETLRAAFLVEAQSVLGEDAVNSVLITDYLMT